MDNGTRVGSTVKACRTCGVEKPYSEFYYCNRDGYFVHCKTCFNAKARASYSADPDHHRAIGRAQQARRRMNHPELFTAEARRVERRRSYEKHREAVIASSRQWRKDHPGATWKQVQAWANKNETNRRRYLHGKIATQARRRDRDGLPRFKPSDVERMLHAQDWRCAYCQCSLMEAAYEVDHKTPIARGGRTVQENLCVACVPCNRRKHTQTAEEFQAVA